MKLLLMSLLVCSLTLTACGSKAPENNAPQVPNTESPAPGNGTDEGDPNKTGSPDSSNPDPSEEPQSDDETDTSFDSTDAVQLMSDYKNRFNRLIDTEDDLKVKDFKSKEGLINFLAEIMSVELATLFADAYFEEDGGDLYVIPREGPLFLDENDPYHLEQINNDTYELRQRHSSELKGDLTFVITFSKRDGQWIIDSFDAQD